MSDSANRCASSRDFPWTITSAFSKHIKFTARFEAVSGTMTITGTERRRPAKATASPAFPPDDAMKRFAPRFRYSSHAYPIPLVLKEPDGCMDSIFSQMDWPTLWLIERDLISGVSICSGIYDSRLDLTSKKGRYSYNGAQEVSSQASAFPFPFGHKFPSAK